MKRVLILTTTVFLSAFATGDTTEPQESAVYCCDESGSCFVGTLLDCETSHPAQVLESRPQLAVNDDPKSIDTSTFELVTVVSCSDELIREADVAGTIERACSISANGAISDVLWPVFSIRREAVVPLFFRDAVVGCSFRIKLDETYAGTRVAAAVSEGQCDF